jgi:hypothetical protein
MRRISSKWTFFYKRVFPIILFSFLVLFVAITVFAGGHSIMKKLIFDLVDEVWDDGRALIVKNDDREERIPFADIKNVNY